MSSDRFRETDCNCCGAPISASELGGLCPACLFKLGFDAKSCHHLHIRCPHCQIAIEIVDDISVREVTCPSCDSRFSLIDDQVVTVDVEGGGFLGRFQLLERVGMGAFGSVWKARDPELERIVAIKIPRRESLASSDAEQFLREARAAAGLKHPGIVSVHEVGRDGNRIYIVSDFIAGVTLADALNARRPSVTESVELCQRIAMALHHAHQNGVIHRDLKPSNIMLDEANSPHVMDFGLAKRDAAEVTMTVEGRILGTPAYMSPEQARGDGYRADARSDVYSLGVILFELLTGEKPFRGSSQMLLHQVLHDDAPSPRKLTKDLPCDLETISLKCLEKEADSRFDSACDLAAELERFLRGEPILSRPISRIQRAYRWCRRNPIVSGLVASVAATLLIGLATTFWQWRRSQRNFVDAQAARVNAQNQQQETAEALDGTRKMLARLYVERGLQKVDIDPHAGLPWLYQAWKAEPLSSSAKEMHRLRIGLMKAEMPALIQFWPSAADAKFNDQGTMVAVAQGSQVILYDLQSRRANQPLRHAQPIVRIAFNHAGDRLATVSQVDDGERRYATPWKEPAGAPMCQIWNALTGDPITPSVNIADDEFRIYNTPKVHFSADDSKLVAIGTALVNRWHDVMSARVYDSQTLQPVSDRFAHHCGMDYADGYHVISPDGLRVAMAQGVSADDPRTDWSSDSFPVDMRPQQWDLMTCKQVHPPLDHELTYYSQPHYSADGSLIATVDGGLAKIWDARTGELIREIKFSSKQAGGHLSFHSEGQQVFAIEKNTATLMDVHSGDVIRIWPHENKFIVGPKAEQFIYKDSSGTTPLTIAGTEQRDLQLPDLYTATFSVDGSRLLI